MPEFNQVCLSSLSIGNECWSLESYRKIGGYEAWQKVLDGELDR